MFQSLILNKAKFSDASDTLNQFADGGVGWPYMGSGFACRETFDLARMWLKDCSEKCPNDNCLPISDATLPTRIVDVGLSERGDPPKLVLSHGKSGKYVALSHCWGGNITSKTTLALVAQYTKALPELPRSFRDAIKITRELGFRYLWIDSLCIIQDSVEDWEIESATMRDVYRNAAVTLAAAASKNSEGGMLNLFGYDQPETRKWCSLKLYSNSLNSESVQLSSFYQKETFMECIDKLPLGHRGWTLQERLLSQRIIHYGKDQIYFQCRTNHFNADKTPVQDSYSILRQSNRALLNLSKPPVQDPFPSRRVATSGDWVNERWRGVISTYSGSRKLTNASDKLPALSGIVSLFQAKTKDEYLAGLWKTDLAHGLMWRLGDYTGPGSFKWKAFRHRAPSWSWACWDGSIRFPFDAMKPTEDDYGAVLLDCKIKYKGLNHFGEVDSGTLRLRCWTRLMTFKEVTEVIGSPALDISRGSWDSQVENEGQAGFLESDHTYTVICVGTFQFATPENTPKGYLLLDPVLEAGEGIFERVGMAPHASWNYLDNFDSKLWKRTEISII